MNKSQSQILCYVCQPWAYFTTQSLETQWGDDWNDAPYQHNAGEPYEYLPHNEKRGDKPWEITKVAYDGPLYAPCDLLEGNFSVEQINKGEIPWLTQQTFADERPITIPAGATLENFCILVKKAGGKVFCNSN